jgi:hypothetical protein
MRIQTPAGIARSIHLQAGQARRVTARPGTVVQVVSGSVRVYSSLRWLAETVITPQLLLNEGQAHAVAEGGWFEVVAVSDAQVLQFEPASPWAALWQRLLQPRACVTPPSTISVEPTT